jgi:hypothetical protein
MLMFTIGVGLWIGSYQSEPVPWDWLGLLAHVIPLTILPYAWGQFAELGLTVMPIGSLVFHTVFIALELGSIYLAPRYVSRAA